MKNKLFIIALVLLTASCGGGGGSSGGTSNVAKTITVRGELEDRNANADGTRDRYEGYQICAFGVCDVTDVKGEFLFTATLPAQASGIEFSITGPEFTSLSGFIINGRPNDIEVVFLRVGQTSTIELGEVLFDGVVDQSITPGGFNDGD